MVFIRVPGIYSLPLVIDQFNAFACSFVVAGAAESSREVSPDRPSKDAAFSTSPLGSFFVGLPGTTYFVLLGLAFGSFD